MAKERASERAIWTGAISFGLVNIPVRLYTATRTHDIAFHQVEEKTGKRIRYKRTAEGSNREIPYQQIAKGYEVSKGRTVVIEPEELEAIEPRKTRTIDVEEFVKLEEIDPAYWDQTYYVGPEDRAGAPKSYALMRRAMEETGRVGIGRFVMRTKEYLVTIRPFGSGLALETMFYADEIRDLNAVIPASVKRTAIAPRELALAKQLIEAQEGHFQPSRFKDEYRARVLDVIRKKARGQEIPHEAPPEEPGQVVDLMEALKASLGRSKKRAAPSRGRKKRAA
jgi:DNA end-binding protein Ku